MLQNAHTVVRNSEEMLQNAHTVVINQVDMGRLDVIFQLLASISPVCNQHNIPILSKIAASDLPSPDTVVLSTSSISNQFLQIPFAISVVVTQEYHLRGVVW